MTFLRCDLSLRASLLVGLLCLAATAASQTPPINDDCEAHAQNLPPRDDVTLVVARF